MLEKLVTEKKCINKNKLYNINKYIIWFIDIRDIVLDFMNQELNKSKLYELMSFISLIKYKDIIFINNDFYKILEIEDRDYKIRFTLEEKEFKIEYSIKESNINYLFDINENQDYNNATNIIYNQVKHNINDILNKKVYYICKEYFLKG